MEYPRIYAKVNMDAILYNIRSMHNAAGDGVRLLAVVKADGYGHGALPIAKALEQEDAIWGFAVATAQEALELRAAGIGKEIMILGYSFREDYERLVMADVRLTVYSYDMARELADAAARCAKPAYIHIKIDTGMHRIGYPVTTQSADEICRIVRLGGLVAEGIFTHLASADEADKTAAKEQIREFRRMLDMLSQRGVSFPVRHCANSAAIMELAESGFDMARAGIAMYGLWPSPEMDVSFPLRPALSLHSHVVCVKWLDEGSPVGYGGTYVTDERQRIATVPVGYADGYPRSLSNRGYVLIRGRRAPIVGRICMDQFMVDVTHIPKVQMLDEVVLIGRDGEEEITVEELGAISHRFNYEFVCTLGNRIPRLYYQDGQLREIKDYFKK